MSAGIDTVRTDAPIQQEPTVSQRKLDVSEVDPERVVEYASATAGDATLYFERKGGRTYLVAR